MNNFLSDTIKLTNKYIVLATPLILFSLVSNIYLLVSASGQIINLIIGVVLLFLMTGAFLAGWFRMVRDAIADDDSNMPNYIMKNFTSGVGEYFLSCLAVIFNIFVIFILISAGTFLTGINLIGDPNINPQALKDALSNVTALKTFMDTLTAEQITKLEYWNWLMVCSMALFYLISMFYFPALFYKSKNPFVAFFVSLKDLFSRKFFKSVGLFLSIGFIYFVLMLLMTVLGNNLIVHFILTLLEFYLITAFTIAIFSYYKTNFVDFYIGQNIDVTL